MKKSDRTCYPFVWFDRSGWWFKVFDERFGPYEYPVDAQHNLRMIWGLSRQLHNELRRQLPL
jgi:hypothetical protein